MYRKIGGKIMNGTKELGGIVSWISRNGIKKTWLAERLGMSVESLHYYLHNDTERNDAHAIQARDALRNLAVAILNRVK